ncbi:MAG: peptidoglycan-binding protein [Rhodobacteraceae bacterium]|nr:peptidoglycan-binding protein [Paracoccaceae bacterium]
MKNLVLSGVVIAANLIFAAAAASQEQDHWLQIATYPRLDEAQRAARELRGTVDRLEIHQTARGRFAVAAGRYTRAEAQQVRQRLLRDGIVSEFSSITSGRHFRRLVQSSAGTRAMQRDTTGEEYGDGEKLAAQTALRWLGDYQGAVDGKIGPQSRAAIRAYQSRRGLPETGALSRHQFNQLIQLYNRDIEISGMQRMEFDSAGISAEIPTGLLELDRIDAPFIYLNPTPGNRTQLIFVSLSGNSLAFETLYGIFENLEFIPASGERLFAGNRFRISAADETIVAEADVRLIEDRIKGYLFVWHPDNSELMLRIHRALSGSFSESSEATLPLVTTASDNSADPLFAGLEIPQPLSRHSGFFIDALGTVATSGLDADSCSHIYLLPDQEMSVAAVDPVRGITLLTPHSQQSPLAFAKFSAKPPSKGAAISVSGYSFGGELGAPSQTYGTMIGKDPASDSERHLLRADIFPGDIGGAVLDRNGAVAGILTTQPQNGRSLPQGLHPFSPSAAISRLALGTGIVSSYSFSRTEPDRIDLNRAASDITVLIECY